MPKGTISYRNIRHISLTFVMVLSLILTGCHTSRKVAAPSSTKVPSTTITVTPDLKQIKTEVAKRDYPTDNISKLVQEAASWLGTPYRYGGHDRSGTDCSGMVMELFKSVLKENLPRSSREQQTFCAEVPKENMQPGDLLFYATGRDTTVISHVGLYIGYDQMIHASSSKGVVVTSITDNYFSKRFKSAGRTSAVSRIYADAGTGNKPVRHTSTSATMTRPQTDIAVPLEQLDQLINEQVDSIFTGFFD